LPTICFIKGANISYRTIEKLFGEVIWKVFILLYDWLEYKKGELGFRIAAINTIPKHLHWLLSSSLYVLFFFTIK
jgi:hypothetical protein